MVDCVFWMKSHDSFDEMNSTMSQSWETAPITPTLPLLNADAAAARWNVAHQPEGLIAARLPILPRSTVAIRFALRQLHPRLTLRSSAGAS